ncbi:MAG: hypothetical protein NTZ65_04960 [Candidatus Berkelbacteria bacterium]|nr:hypothetical protein [Candidatus Berkelbacteria bacterium]
MLFLIFLDFIWSVSAFIYDWSKFATIPWFVLPFVVICPIYPLLLAIVWIKIFKKKNPNQYLFTFATIPSMIFGLLALIYYPVAMFYQGFSLNAFGQIFWVLFYSIQAWYLFFKYKTSTLPIILVLFYLSIKFFIDYKYLTFGYLDFSNIPRVLILYFTIIAVSVAFCLGTLAIFRRKS